MNEDAGDGGTAVGDGGQADRAIDAAAGDGGVPDAAVGEAGATPDAAVVDAPVVDTAVGDAAPAPSPDAPLVSGSASASFWTASAAGAAKGPSSSLQISVSGFGTGQTLSAPGGASLVVGPFAPSTR